MEKYVPETAEEFNSKIARAKRMISEESLKLYAVDQIKYEFDSFSGEVRLFFVKQTDFTGGKLTHGHLDPLVKRLKEINKRWHTGIMVYGASHRNE